MSSARQTSKPSLTVTGTPCSGLTSLPRAIASSAVAAARSAASPTAFTEVDGVNPREQHLGQL